MFVYDRVTRTRYLIDTGADVSVLPAESSIRRQVTGYKLYAANITCIDT